MTLRTTIVGCGAVTQQLYLPALRRLERERIVRVVALVDTDRARAEAVQRALPRAERFEDVGLAVVRSGSALTLVATPPAFHEPAAIAALHAGSHVLCEKPLAIGSAPCARMLTAARTVGRMLAVGMTRRFYPVLQNLSQMLEAGILQPPLTFVYREGRAYNWPVATADAFRRDRGGVGVLYDIGSHVLDLLAWLLGDPQILACHDDALDGGVETNVRVRLRMPQAEGVMQLSWEHELVNEFRLRDAYREAVVDLNRWDEVRLCHAGEERRWGSASEGVRPRSHEECIYQELRQMARAVTGQGDFPVTGEEGMRTVSLLEECARRAMPLEQPWLSPLQNAACQARHWSRS